MVSELNTNREPVPSLTMLAVKPLPLAWALIASRACCSVALAGMVTSKSTLFWVMVNVPPLAETTELLSVKR
ncbi:hypothetical protein D3C85_1900410 [compost metagenome]